MHIRGCVCSEAQGDLEKHGKGRPIWGTHNQIMLEPGCMWAGLLVLTSLHDMTHLHVPHGSPHLLRGVSSPLRES